MVENFEAEVKSLNELRTFLKHAPELFTPGERIKRHELPNAEIVSCIRWNQEFLMSGADILRCVVYRFEAFGREVVNRAKFEELVFSDLRSLKTNVRARLEEGKSEMLEFLHKYGCIRTKKKQRVFYWYAIPHERLFLESLERELRRAVIDDSHSDNHRITVAVREPALSMPYDPMQKVVHQINRIMLESPPNQREILSAVLGLSPHDTEIRPRPGELLINGYAGHHPSQNQNHTSPLSKSRGNPQNAGGHPGHPGSSPTGHPPHGAVHPVAAPHQPGGQIPAIPRHHQQQDDENGDNNYVNDNTSNDALRAAVTVAAVTTTGTNTLAAYSTSYHGIDGLAVAASNAANGAAATPLPMSMQAASNCENRRLEYHDAAHRMDLRLPGIDDSQRGRDVRLPSIRDALPPHAQLDLFALDSMNPATFNRQNPNGNNQMPPRY